MTMQNKRKISATTILMNIIKRFLIFIRPACQFIALSYAVTLGYRRVKRLEIEILYNISSVFYTVIILKMTIRSFIGSGLYYLSLSFEKRLSILWASDKGDWSHWMTGERYLLCRDLKNDLISQDSFARLLNNLASNGFFGKLIQILLLLMCLAIFSSLIVLLLKCLKHFANTIKVLL